MEDTIVLTMNIENVILCSNKVEDANVLTKNMENFTVFTYNVMIMLHYRLTI